MSWRIGVKHEQKEAVSRSREDFPTCGSGSTPSYIIKRSATRILSTPKLLQVVIYLFFPPKSPTEVLKLTPQRRHASEIRAFADFFGVREEFFRPALIRLNLVTALSRFREQCSLEDLELKCV